jgi:transposase
MKVLPSLGRLFRLSLKEATAMGNKVTDSRKGRKSNVLRLLEDEAAFVGVDMHKHTYSVAVCTEQRGYAAVWIRPARPALLCSRLEPIRSQLGGIVHEAGPTGYGLYHHLEAQELPVNVVAPSRTLSAPGRSGKSDRRDSRKLAKLSAKGMLCPIYVPDGQEEADRQLVRCRDQVMGDRTRVKNRVKSFLVQHAVPGPHGLKDWSQPAVEGLPQLPLSAEFRLVLDSLLLGLDHANDQLGPLDRELAALASSERHAAVIDRLTSIPGVGPLTALIFRVEVLHPERFATGQKVADYLALWVGQSGESRRDGPGMKAGNKRVRRQLVEVSWQWTRRDPQAQAVYRRPLAKTASRKKPTTAMACRLATCLWRRATEPERPC